MRSSTAAGLIAHRPVNPDNTRERSQDYYARLRQGFLEAESGNDRAVRSYFKLGDRVVCIRYLGNTLQQFQFPALAHLRCEPDTPDLTILAWTASELSIANIPRPWSVDKETRRGDVVGHNFPSFFSYHHAVTGLTNIFDACRDTAIYYTEDIERLAFAERGLPFLTILHWWLSSQGIQIVHSAGLGDSRGAILLVGKGGVGKSTTAMHWFNDGYSLLGEDYCIITPDTHPTVHSIFCSAKLVPGELETFPALAASIRNPGKLAEEKALLDLFSISAEQITLSAPLKAIVAPRLSGQAATSLTPITTGEALRIAAPSTLMQLSRSAPANFHNLTRIVKSVPAYALELGTDRKSISPVLHQLLNSLI